jgi:hypothetical protein
MKAGAASKSDSDMFVRVMTGAEKPSTFYDEANIARLMGTVEVATRG